MALNIACNKKDNLLIYSLFIKIIKYYITVYTNI